MLSVNPACRFSQYFHLDNAKKPEVEEHASLLSVMLNYPVPSYLNCLLFERNDGKNKKNILEGGGHPRRLCNYRQLQYHDQ
jgi:hypothetical protein